MKITNPETGAVHDMDKAAFAELRESVKQAQDDGHSEVVFRAMRLDRIQAERLLIADV
jgi:hypothetical protein